MVLEPQIPISQVKGLSSMTLRGLPTSDLQQSLVLKEHKQFTDLGRCRGWQTQRPLLAPLLTFLPAVFRAGIQS